MIMSVALLKTLLSSLLKIVYIVFDVSGKELYSKPTINLSSLVWLCGVFAMHRQSDLCSVWNKSRDYGMETSRDYGMDTKF